MRTILNFISAALVAAPLALMAQGSSTNVQMVPAHAVLTKPLDAAKAKQGDPVMARLERGVILGGGTKLPKNTMLVGQVDQAQPSQGQGQSTLEVTFDKAEMKDGKTMPVKATVMQIGRPRGGETMAVEGSNPNGPTPIPPPTGTMEGGTGGSSGNMPSSGNLPVRVKDHSSYHGITLRSDVHDQDSGTFTDPKKDVKLGAGTELIVAVAPVQSGMSAQ